MDGVTDILRNFDTANFTDIPAEQQLLCAGSGSGSCCAGNQHR